MGTEFRLAKVRWGRRAATEVDRFETVHWDTPDFRLAAWEAGLDFRRGRGWRVTLAGEVDGAGLRRRYVDLDGGAAVPPAAAIRLLSGYLSDVQPRPVVRLRHLESRRCVGRLQCVHQVVSRLMGRRAVAHTRRVTLQSPSPMDDARRPLAALRRAGAMEVTRTPLLTELVGAEAAPRWRAPELGPESRVAGVVSAALRDYAARLVRNQPLVLEGSDPEGVHQARVACRRIRSALQSFEPLLEPDWADSLRADLAVLAAALGSVRDTEVLLARLSSSAAEYGLDTELSNRLLAPLEGERARARQVLVARMESPEHRSELDRLLAAAASPAVLATVADQPAVDALRPLVAASWRRLRRRGSRLAARPADGELHRLRILAKRCRYAVLVLVPVLGEAPARTAALLGALQDELGEQHDSVIAGEWLQRAADGEAGFAAGVLYAVERERAEAARKAWRKPWTALDIRRRWEWV